MTSWKLEHEGEAPRHVLAQILSNQLLVLGAVGADLWSGGKHVWRYS